MVFGARLGDLFGMRRRPGSLTADHQAPSALMGAGVEIRPLGSGR